MNQVRDFKAPSGRMVCIANVNGRLYAMDNVCPHRGGALGQGTVEGGFVVCPWHGWQIRPETGVPEQDRSCTVECYQVEVVGDDVLITSALSV